MNPVLTLYLALLLSLAIPVTLLQLKIARAIQLKFDLTCLLLIISSIILPLTTSFIFNTYWIDRTTVIEEVCEARTISIFKWKWDK